MDERAHKIAAMANAVQYDSQGVQSYTDHAPHLKHKSLRALYGRLVVEVFDYAKRNGSMPRVLDLGAGEGSVTLPFLELGARVVAVDLSAPQLDNLKKKCKAFGDRLEIHCENIDETLKRKDERYDIVVTNSFLHHVPDYLGMIRGATELLSPQGQFFSFQDPLRYDTVGRFTRLFGNTGYFTWRVCRGDVIGGLKRRLRRARGVYLEDSIHDNSEYHVVRNGVDQNAIHQFFVDQHIPCRIVRYYSDQSRLFQMLGAGMRLENTFAVIAQKGAQIQ